MLLHWHRFFTTEPQIGGSGPGRYKEADEKELDGGREIFQARKLHENSLHVPAGYHKDHLQLEQRKIKMFGQRKTKLGRVGKVVQTISSCTLWVTEANDGFYG